MMQTYITSDLHLGCSHSQPDAFMAFLEGLPDGVRLVLNGDIINHYYSDEHLAGTHREALDAIRAESLKREVIWTRGNNDRELVIRDPGNIQLVDDYAIGRRLYVAHGHRFDFLLPTARVVLIPIRFLHDAVMRLMGSRVHVAQNAKRLPSLYRVLCRHVAGNAVRYAKKHGYEAVACGHTHYSEDREVKGIRYLNTGSWTEPNRAVVVVDDDGIRCHGLDSPANQNWRET